MPEIDIRKTLPKLFRKGFLKSLREGDTGVGFTIETELGIKENNSENVDFTYNGAPVELKTQREHASSNITLFTKEPEKGKFNDASLIKKYGYADVYGRRGLKITLTTKEFNPQGFKLEINESEEKINIVHERDGNIWYYSLNDIFAKLHKKLADNLLVVIAESKEEKDGEYLHYKRAYFLSNLSEEKFIQLLREGKFVIEFRMHLKPTGIVRNHGTGFRLNERYLADLYETKEIIE
ncbi:hypothetical protein HZA99_05055 [Candidatus Woesearchaeota archaeon]|nr:hypothetical protein [Candidatus Woesearchaeota archaeon]